MSYIKKIAVSKLILVLVPLLFLMPLSQAKRLQAQNIDMPILIMGEDASDNSLPRNSDVFQRVLVQLKSSLQQHNLRVIDEESAAVDLGLRINKRRSKAELASIAKIFNGSQQAQHQHRLWVLFRVHVSIQNLEYANKTDLRIDGEIYDSITNGFIDNVELAAKTFPTPKNCYDTCLRGMIGDRARDMAASLGKKLAKKLVHYYTTNIKNTNKNAQPVVFYNVDLRNFNHGESKAVIGVMSNEFPGYVSHKLLAKTAQSRIYSYHSHANATKLEEWLAILLTDMGFDIDNDLSFTIDQNNIMIEKINLLLDRQISEDEIKYTN